MVKSIHRGVWNWLKGCDAVRKLGFSYGIEANGATIMIPNEQTEMYYNDGTELRTYACMIVVIRGVSFAANDDGNIAVLEDVDEIAKWMEVQIAAENLPELPEGCTIDDITVRHTQTGMSAAQDGLYAKYMIPFEIKYITKE